VASVTGGIFYATVDGPSMGQQRQRWVIHGVEEGPNKVAS
jgi:hypothetical protein